MIIAFGNDHAAFPVRAEILRHLASRGFQVKDFGCPTKDPCDYPDIAVAVAKAVSNGEAERGILICGTGVGMSIAANKVRGVRAAVCWSDEVAALVSEHNSANVLCLGARTATPEQMRRWIDIWLATPASTEPRHVRRIDKITACEGNR